MTRIINFNGNLYEISRRFKIDGWFGRVVENMDVEEILQNYHCDKLLKDSSGFYYLVNEINDAKIIEEIS